MHSQLPLLQAWLRLLHLGPHMCVQPANQNSPYCPLPLLPQIQHFRKNLTPFDLMPQSHKPTQPQRQEMQKQPSSAYVLSALAERSIASLSSCAAPSTPGIIFLTPSASGSTKPFTSETQTKWYAATGKRIQDVPKSTTLSMPVQDASLSCTELVHALELRGWRPVTPYESEAWKCALKQAGMLNHFECVVEGLQTGFIVGFPLIVCIQSPPIVSHCPYTVLNSS